MQVIKSACYVFLFFNQVWHAALIFVKTITVSSTILPQFSCHHTSNCSEISTGRMLICVLTDSVLEFPHGVCLYWRDWGSQWVDRFTFIGIVLILPINVHIDFNPTGIASGFISLPHCYSMLIVTEHICIFNETATEHTNKIYWGHVDTDTGHMCMFLDFSSI